MKKLLFFALFIVPMIIAPCPARADDLGDATARAEESRQKAGDFEVSAYFPSDWEAAEAIYAYASTPGDYNAAADAFDALFEKAVPLYAQAREDEIMAIRGHLLAMGARDITMEYFGFADETALEALDEYEAGNYYPARDTGAQALAMYEVLLSACSAWLVRQEIREREFESYDPENFDRAGEVLNRAMDAYEVGKNSQALEDAEEAFNRYKLVLSTAWASYAQARSSQAESERNAAFEAKANIATRELFAEAEAFYKRAVDIFEAKNYEEAATEFIHAEALFITASSAAIDKRRSAADAIQEAQKKIEESDEIARQAEIVLKGGAQ